MSFLLIKIIETIFPQNSRRRKFFKLVFYRLYKKFINLKFNRDYKKWININEPLYDELIKQKNTSFSFMPKISIIVPVYNTPKRLLIEMINSVRCQTYPNWELCLSVSGRMSKKIKNILDGYINNRPDEIKSKIKIKYSQLDKGIAINTNEALTLATGDYIAFLDHDDILADFALYELIKFLEDHNEADLIYSDEDILSFNSKKRHSPHFKPDFSPVTITSCNYICHLVMLKKTLGDRVGWLRPGYDGAQDYDLILRIKDIADKIYHIPKILYHWRESKYSVAGSSIFKDYAFDNGKKALQNYFYKKEKSVEIHMGNISGIYQIIYNLKNLPMISIIIDDYENKDILYQCLNSIVSKTDYPEYEIIILNKNLKIEGYDELKNKSRLIILDYKFQEYAETDGISFMRNFAASHANGKYLLFIKGSIKIIHPDWLKRLIDQTVNKETGAIGPMIYYPNNKIKSSGIIIDNNGFIKHLYRNYSRGSRVFIKMLNMAQNVRALSADCILTEKEIFNALNGFDSNLSDDFSAVDFCLRLLKKGYWIVWTPFAEIYSMEYDTLIYQKQEKINKERFLMQWGNVIKERDPYHNKNLSFEKGDFSIKLK